MGTEVAMRKRKQNQATDSCAENELKELPRSNWADPRSNLPPIVESSAEARPPIVPYQAGPIIMVAGHRTGAEGREADRSSIPERTRAVPSRAERTRSIAGERRNLDVQVKRGDGAQGRESRHIVTQRGSSHRHALDVLPLNALMPNAHREPPRVS